MEQTTEQKLYDLKLDPRYDLSTLPISYDKSTSHRQRRTEHSKLNISPNSNIHGKEVSFDIDTSSNSMVSLLESALVLKYRITNDADLAGAGKIADYLCPSAFALLEMIQDINVSIDNGKIKLISMNNHDFRYAVHTMMMKMSVEELNKLNESVGILGPIYGEDDQYSAVIPNSAQYNADGIKTHGGVTWGTGITNAITQPTFKITLPDPPVAGDVNCTPVTPVAVVSTGTAATQAPRTILKDMPKNSAIYKRFKRLGLGENANSHLKTRFASIPFNWLFLGASKSVDLLRCANNIQIKIRFGPRNGVYAIDSISANVATHATPADQLINASETGRIQIIDAYCECMYVIPSQEQKQKMLVEKPMTSDIISMIMPSKITTQKVEGSNLYNIELDRHANFYGIIMFASAGDEYALSKTDGISAYPYQGALQVGADGTKGMKAKYTNRSEQYHLGRIFLTDLSEDTVRNSYVKTSDEISTASNCKNANIDEIQLTIGALSYPSSPIRTGSDTKGTTSYSPDYNMLFNEMLHATGKSQYMNIQSTLREKEYFDKFPYVFISPYAKSNGLKFNPQPEKLSIRFKSHLEGTTKFTLNIIVLTLANFVISPSGALSKIEMN